MNSKHKNIKFTLTEDSNNFPFLDVKITYKNKPHLVKLLLITIVLFLIPKR